MLKIYVAHNFEARFFLNSVDWFKDFELTSRWITEAPFTSLIHEYTAEEHKANAIMDYEDLRRADCLVLFIDPFKLKTGKGKWFEFGAAYALDKPIVLVGEEWDGCVFNYLPNVYKCSDIQAMKDTLRIVERELTKATLPTFYNLIEDRKDG